LVGCETNKWDVSGVTDFTDALSDLSFPECNDLLVDCWDVSSGTIFENMVSARFILHFCAPPTPAFF